MQAICHRSCWLIAWRKAGARCLLTLVVLFLSGPAFAERYAVLVGINRYDHPKLAEPPLKYAVSDVTDLAEVLRAAGYTVKMLNDEAGVKDPAAAPTKKNIEAAKNIDAALSAVLASAKLGDTVLVALCGHGLRFDGQKSAYVYGIRRPAHASALFRAA